ncbi:chromosome segregation protein SMC [Sesbania bispinosa]|nr:chromosome segregation protein SMC [Sesbania bispinosa]
MVMVVKIAIQHVKSIYDLRHTVRCRMQPESESGEIEAESLPEAVKTVKSDNFTAAASCFIAGLLSGP